MIEEKYLRDLKKGGDLLSSIFNSKRKVGTLHTIRYPDKGMAEIEERVTSDMRRQDLINPRGPEKWELTNLGKEVMSKTADLGKKVKDYYNVTAATIGEKSVDEALESWMGAGALLSLFWRSNKNRRFSFLLTTYALSDGEEWVKKSVVEKKMPEVSERMVSKAYASQIIDRLADAKNYEKRDAGEIRDVIVGWIEDKEFSDLPSFSLPALEVSLTQGGFRKSLKPSDLGKYFHEEIIYPFGKEVKEKGLEKELEERPKRAKTEEVDVEKLVDRVVRACKEYRYDKVVKEAELINRKELNEPPTLGTILLKTYLRGKEEEGK